MISDSAATERGATSRTGTQSRFSRPVGDLAADLGPNRVKGKMARGATC
jgi:hypothetical protein